MTPGTLGARGTREGIHASRGAGRGSRFTAVLLLLAATAAGAFAAGAGTNGMDAVGELRNIVELDPGNEAAMFELGAALIGLGRHGEALSLYERLLELRPDSPQVKNNIAWISVVAGEAPARNLERGEKLAVEAVIVLHDDPNVWNTVATAHYEAGRYVLAFRAARIALWLAKASGEQGIWAHWELVRRCRRAAAADGGESEPEGDWSW